MSPVIKILSIKENPETDGFSGKLYETFKELIPILSNFSKYLKRREHFLHHSVYHFGISIILIPKLDKDTTKKLYSNILYEHGHKNLQ